MQPSGAFPANTDKILEAFQSAGLGWWEYNAKTDQLHWSQKCKHIFGLYSDRELNYADWASSVHPDDFQRADEQLSLALNEMGVYDEKYRAVGIEDGKVRWVRSIGKVTYDDAGKPEKMIGVLLETSSTKLEEAISEQSNVRVKLIADTMPQLVWCTEPDGYHDFFNRRWYEFTGLTYERTKGEGWNAVLHPDDQERAWTHWRHSLETGDPYEIEYRFRRHDGEYRWFLGRALPLRDGDGNVSKWFGTCTDIHEQKLASEEIERTNASLAESEKRFRTLTVNSPDLITRHGRDFRYLYASPHIQRFTGIEAEKFIGRNYWEMGLPEDLCRFFDEQLKIVFERKVLHLCGYITQTEEPVYMESRLVPEFDEDGEMVSVLVISTDITERKKSEDALRYQTQLLSDIANTLPLVVWTADPSGSITFVNEQWERLYGHAEKEGLGAGWMKFVHPSDLAYVTETWSRSIESGQNYEVEFRIRNANNVYRWMLVRATPLKDADDNVLSWHGSNTDIHDKKQFENLLEEKVLQRTKELERRNAELEQFTFVSHHDLQEPLRKITMFTEMVKAETDGTVPESVSLRLEKISNASRIMREALRDVLDFASLNKAETFVPVDLDEMLASVIMELEPVINDKKARISSCPLPVVDAVPHQMQQLFYNLLANSLKFVAPGQSPEISIDFEKRSSEPEDGNTVYTFCITDNGIGFDPLHSEKIFKLFQRLHTKDEIPGNGIGLALCKKIVENHSGRIWAESSPGQGAKFTFTIVSN